MSDQQFTHCVHCGAFLDGPRTVHAKTCPLWPISIAGMQETAAHKSEAPIGAASMVSAQVNPADGGVGAD